jgi:hypothetical protein
MFYVFLAGNEGLILQLTFFEEAHKLKCSRIQNTSVFGIRHKNKKVKYRTQK